MYVIGVLRYKLMSDYPKKKKQAPKRKRTIRIVLLLSALIGMSVWISNYTPNRYPSPVDIDLFSSLPCEINCWHMLEIGASESDVREYASTYLTNMHQSYNRGGVYISGKHEDGYSLTTFIQNNQLRIITLGSSIGLNVTLETIFQELGTPNFSLLSYYASHWGNNIFPFAKLYYPDKGYIFELELTAQNRTQDTVDLCIMKDDVIQDVSIVEPSSIDQMVTTREILNYPMINDTQITRFINSLSNWNGFGCRTIRLTPAS